MILTKMIFKIAAFVPVDQMVLFLHISVTIGLIKDAEST